MAERPVSIAIVDDDRPFGLALQRLLRAHGLAAATFASGREFLDSLGSWSPDCLLLDLQMPSMGGVAVMRHVADTGRRLPTIIITAHDDPDARTQCLAAGASGFLYKPVDEADLLGVIASVIGDVSAISRQLPNGRTRGLN